MKEPAEFVDDISVKGMIHALAIRSPVAKGILKDIECPKLPGRYHLFEAGHIPGENRLANFSIPVLVDRNLSYIGQPVAILAGPEESVLEDLASQINIIAEEEPPLFSHTVYSPEEAVVKQDIVSGDTDKVFGGSKKIVSGVYATGIQGHWYSESHGAVVVPSFHASESEKGKKEIHALAVFTASQWLSHVQRSAAGVLGWDSRRIEVFPTKMAEHLDGKIWYPSLVACHAVLASFLTGSPVKLILTREEDFMFSPKRNGAEIEIRSALGEKGEIAGSAIRINLDLGAGGIFEEERIDHTCLGSLGVYQHGAFRIISRGIRTNIPPQGPLAGFGLSQGFFAAERHISRIADFLNQDPAEYRKKIFLAKNQGLAIGTALKNPMPLPELINAVAAMSDYYRKWASYELIRNRRKKEKGKLSGEHLRGIGISIAYQGIGFLNNDESGNGNCSAEATLGKDGSLEIKTNLVSSGRFLDTWRNLAQDILGVDMSMIRLINNPGEAPDGGPGTLSRNVGFITKLVERCCMAIRKQRFRDPLPITVKRFAKPEKAPGWVPDRKIDPAVFARPGVGASVVEIEIDPVSLQPLVRGIWLAVDGGKILSQRRARRSLKTGIIQALGWTCREQIRYEEGKIPSRIYRGCGLLTPAEISPIYVDFVWNETAGPKGIGELPFCCVPAAYVQAVSQAMDHPFNKIPLIPRDIWEARHAKETENEL